MTLAIISIIINLLACYLWYKVGQRKEKARIAKELIKLSQDFTTDEELNLAKKILEIN